MSKLAIFIGNKEGKKSELYLDSLETNVFTTEPKEMPRITDHPVP
jgi:hypothetical protein